MRPKISIVIPTRERAKYLFHSVQTCLASDYPELEIVVADNASRDETTSVVQSISDPRVRYIRSDRRLSMRDNFERGISAARGTYVGIIGDDDGIFPHTPARVVELFEVHEVDAVSAARAHYFWPDLNLPRAGYGLLPREHAGLHISRSRSALRGLLGDNDYYRLPCIYHGFVARAAVERYCTRMGRLLLSSIADAASTFALCLDDIHFAWTAEPLVINGGSVRSNGASQFGGGGKKERENWKAEDDLGFLPGFDDCLTVGALLIETAVRYQRAERIANLAEILDAADIRQTLLRELEARSGAGRDLAEALKMFRTAGQPVPALGETSASRSLLERSHRRLQLFTRQLPIDLRKGGVQSIDEAAKAMAAIIETRSTGFVSDLPAQLRAAWRMATG
jgi:glycosyltransferase involved in cell wall biosynthesis